MGRYASANGDALTERQAEVLGFIKGRAAAGYPPTVREIGEHFGIASPNGVMCHLHALEKKGRIRRAPNMSRAIAVAPDTKQKQERQLVKRILRSQGWSNRRVRALGI